jgi:hypothetical protein
MTISTAYTSSPYSKGHILNSAIQQSPGITKRRLKEWGVGSCSGAKEMRRGEGGENRVMVIPIPPIVLLISKKIFG